MKECLLCENEDEDLNEWREMQKTVLAAVQVRQVHSRAAADFSAKLVNGPITCPSS